MTCATFPDRRDLQTELHTVRSALDTATEHRRRIEAEISRTSSIGQLIRLHDAFALVTEEQQQAAQRQRELIDLLSD